jgi:hypothetical protein
MNALTRFATRAAVRPLPTTTGGTGYPWQDGDILYADDLNAAITPNVKNLGATGDGVTDDGPAFIAALAAAAGGGTVVIPAGTYRIGSALPRNLTGGVSIVGAGSGATTLSFPNGTDGLMFTLTAAANVHVHGLTITRAVAGAYTNTGLSITSPAPNATRFGNITIHDVVMAGAWLTGINVVASLVSLDHVLVLMANATGGGPGVGIQAAGVDGANYLVELTLNDVETIGGNVGLLIGTWVQGVYVTQSRFIGNDYGIRWDGVDTHGDLWMAVSNSHFNSGTRGLLTFTGMSPQIVNTYSLHFGIPAIGGVYAAFEFHNIGPGMISNSSIYCADAASPSATEYGIILNGGNNVTIVGNFISMAKNAGIYINGTVNTLVTGNIVGLAAGVPMIQYAAIAPSNQAYGNQLNGVPDITTDSGGVSIGAVNNTGTQLTINGGANTNRMLDFTTNNSSRWFFGVDGSIPEGAGNAGGDLAIISAGDAGLIEKIFSIKRSTGVLSLPHPITFSGPLTQAANDAAAATALVPVGGMYRNGSALMIRVT